MGKILLNHEAYESILTDIDNHLKEKMEIYYDRNEVIFSIVQQIRADVSTIVEDRRYRAFMIGGAEQPGGKYE